MSRTLYIPKSDLHLLLSGNSLRFLSVLNEQETMGRFFGSFFHRVWQWWGSIHFAEVKLRGNHAKVRNSISPSTFCRWWIHPSVYQVLHLLISFSQKPWQDDVSEFQSWVMSSNFPQPIWTMLRHLNALENFQGIDLRSCRAQHARSLVSIQAFPVTYRHTDIQTYRHIHTDKRHRGPKKWCALCHLGLVVG